MKGKIRHKLQREKQHLYLKQQKGSISKNKQTRERSDTRVTGILTGDKEIEKMKNLLRENSMRYDDGDGQNVVSTELENLLNEVQEGDKRFRTKADLEKSLKFFIVRGATYNNLQERIQLLKDNNSISGNFDPDFHVKRSSEKIRHKIQEKVQERPRLSVEHTDQGVQSITRRGTDILLNFKNDDKEIAISHYAELLKDSEFKKKVINTLSIFNGNVQVSYTLDKRKYFIKEDGPFEMDFIWYVSGKKYKVTVGVSVNGVHLISVDGNFSDVFKEAVQTNKDINALLGYEQDVEILKMKDDCLIKCLHIGEELSLFASLRRGKIKTQMINENIVHETPRSYDSGLTEQQRHQGVTHLSVKMNELGLSDITHVAIPPISFSDKSNHFEDLGKGIAELGKENNQEVPIYGNQGDRENYDIDHSIVRSLEISQGDKEGYCADDESEDEQHTISNSSSITTCDDDEGYYTDDESEDDWESLNESSSSTLYDNQKYCGDEKHYQSTISNLSCNDTNVTQLSNSDDSGSCNGRLADRSEYEFDGGQSNGKESHENSEDAILSFQADNKTRCGKAVPIFIGQDDPENYYADNKTKGILQFMQNGSENYNDDNEYAEDDMERWSDSSSDIGVAQLNDGQRYSDDEDKLSVSNVLSYTIQLGDGYDSGDDIRQSKCDNYKTETQQKHVVQKLQEAIGENKKLFEKITNVEQELNSTSEQLQKITEEHLALFTELANVQQEFDSRLAMERQEKADTEQKLQETAQERDELNEKVIDLQKDTNELIHKLYNTEQKLQATKQERDALNEKVIHIQESYDELREGQKATLGNLEKNTNKLRQELNDTTQQLEEEKKRNVCIGQELQKRVKEHDELIEKVIHLPKDTDELTHKLYDTEQKLQETKQERDKSNEEVIALQKNSNELTQMLTGIEQQLAIERLESADTKQELQKECNKLNKKVIQIQESYDELREEQKATLGNLETNNNKLRQELNDTTQQLAEEKKRNVCIGQELQKRMKEHDELIEKVIHLPKDTDELTHNLYDTEQKLQETKQERDKSNEEVIALQKNSNELTQMLTDVEQQLNDYRKKERTGQWGYTDDLKERLKDLEQAKEDEKKVLYGEFDKEYSQLESRMKESDTELLDVQEQVKVLMEEKMAVEECMKELLAKLEERKKTEIELRLGREELSGKLSDAEEAYSRTNDLYWKEEAEHSLLKKNDNYLQQELNSTKESLQAAQRLNEEFSKKLFQEQQKILVAKEAQHKNEKKISELEQDLRQTSEELDNVYVGKTQQQREINKLKLDKDELEQKLHNNLSLSLYVNPAHSGACNSLVSSATGESQVARSNKQSRSLSNKEQDELHYIQKDIKDVINALDCPTQTINEIKNLWKDGMVDKDSSAEEINIVRHIIKELVNNETDFKDRDSFLNALQQLQENIKMLQHGIHSDNVPDSKVTIETVHSNKDINNNQTIISMLR